MDNKGQIALEYLLIFAVSLIVMVAFTLPFLEETMENTFDVSDSLKTKDDLSKIAQAIKIVYGEGQGSKQTVNLNLKDSIKIDVNNYHVVSKIKLKNRQNKVISVDVNSNLDSDSFRLSKGKNTLVIEWPVGSENLIIYEN